MKKPFIIIISFFSVIACTNSKKGDPVQQDKRVVLRSDTVNLVKMTDTMIIFESTCRGCAYEASTEFDVRDSLGIVKLDRVITTDNNPSGVDGGSISKDLVLVPVKTGLTTIVVNKIWGHEQDSSGISKLPPDISSYTIDVRN